MYPTDLSVEDYLEGPRSECDDRMGGVPSTSVEGFHVSV